MNKKCITQQWHTLWIHIFDEQCESEQYFCKAETQVSIKREVNRCLPIIELEETIKTGTFS